MISSIKTFKCFQDGYSFSRSLPRAVPEYCFLSLSNKEFEQVQGGFENLEQVCHFQNCHMSYALYMYMYISAYATNRKGILGKMVHEHGRTLVFPMAYYW